MDPTSLKFLTQILETPSPSGYESQLQQVVRGYADIFADEVTTDVHGNVMMIRNPGAPLRIMLAGHCDQIGLIVQHIDNEGFLYVLALGGWDPQMLIGQRMTVWTDEGPLLGVVARKPIHLLTEEERKQALNMAKDTAIAYAKNEGVDLAKEVGMDALEFAIESALALAKKKLNK